MKLHTVFLPEPLTYTGAELHSHFAMERTGLMGDAIVAFIGPAEVKDHLVDMEDRQNNDHIRSASMLHFIVEHFGMPLAEAVVRQRLIMAGIHELIVKAPRGTGRVGDPVPPADLSRRESPPGARRNGDDLFVGDRKLSVSIATVSPVSAMIHIGLNIDPKGAPVPAIGLAELGLDPQTVGVSVMEWYALEHESMDIARVKVKGVR